MIFLGAAGEKAAGNLAQAWLESNWLGYQEEGNKMVEKYDALQSGVSGGGGEYGVQTGFGWTNGVMLDLLNEYGWNPNPNPKNATSVISPAPAMGTGMSSSG